MSQSSQSPASSSQDDDDKQNHAYAISEQSNQVKHGENKENERAFSTLSTEPAMTSLKKKSLPPTPSILDFMSDAEVKRLTKANTRKNIGERRKTFRSPFSRRRTENLPLPFHEQDDYPITIQAIPVVDSVSPRPTNNSNNLDPRRRSSLPQPKSAPLVDLSSPVTPALQPTRTPFDTPPTTPNENPHPAPSPTDSTVSSSIDQRLDNDDNNNGDNTHAELDLTIEPAPESVTSFEVGSGGPPSTPTLPPTMSLAPSYQKKLLEKGDTSAAWAATRNVVGAIPVGSPVVKPPRSVRICSRVKVVDYLKQRPISPSNSYARPPPRANKPAPLCLPSPPVTALPETQGLQHSPPSSTPTQNSSSIAKDSSKPKTAVPTPVPEVPPVQLIQGQMAPKKRFLSRSTSSGSPSSGWGSKTTGKTAAGMLSGACERMALFLPGRKKPSPSSLLSQEDSPALIRTSSSPMENYTGAVSRSTSASAVLPCPCPDKNDAYLEASKGCSALPVTDVAPTEDVMKLCEQMESLLPRKPS